ncbi:uncharacterized protein EMH_0099090 [Eimeria mitis]|uniref:Uncharacterized protein n=1 Tax=Eimeria mitis TaxID=44415 RepID=U6JN54_9EIME|nr:uncharacterized protein EMH_0099090 [Eimeria mitis]CDJ26975.1 hypothetical protein, conserved [Eimeria mitis]
MLSNTELEALAEAVAEGVANSTTYGLRSSLNPLAAAAAAARAFFLSPFSVSLQEIKSLPAVAQLVDPLNLLQLKQQLAALQQQKGRSNKPREEDELQQQQQQQQQLREEENTSPAAADVSESAAANRSSSSPSAAATAAAAAAAAAADDEEDSSPFSPPPQRFNRTTPLGLFQGAAEQLYFLQWALTNPLSMFEWKAEVYRQCLLQTKGDTNACSSRLAVDPAAVSLGGVNSPWMPSSTL